MIRCLCSEEEYSRNREISRESVEYDNVHPFGTVWNERVPVHQVKRLTSNEEHVEDIPDVLFEFEMPYGTAVSAFEATKKEHVHNASRLSSNQASCPIIIGNSYIRDALNAAYVQEFLQRSMMSSIGWPMSDLFLHHMKCKQAVACASSATRRELRNFIFRSTEKPSTHRECFFNIYAGCTEIETRSGVLSADAIAAMPDNLLRNLRQDVAKQGKVFGPGSAFYHLLVGNGQSSTEDPTPGTVIGCHVVFPGNPHFVESFFRWPQQCLKIVHDVFANTSMRSRLASDVLETLAALFPESTHVLSDLLLCSSNGYEVSETGVPNVLRHSLEVTWNLPAIRKRFGQVFYDLVRGRPSYTATVEEAVRDSDLGFAPVAMNIIETNTHSILITFLTLQTGGLVWADADGNACIEHGKVREVPDFFQSEFRVRVTECKLPLIGCACLLNTVALPTVLLSIEAVRTPHHIVKVRCLEVGPFPMETFFRPLFNLKLMRELLVQRFTAEFHFIQDEVHLHISLQIPKLASLLKSVLRSFSMTLIEVIFGAASEDPVPVLLEAMGRDCAKAEASIPRDEKHECSNSLRKSGTVISV